MTYDAFTLAIMREAARCIPLPIAVATGDSSQMNYASGRLDKQAGDLVIDCDRKVARSNLQQQDVSRVVSRGSVDPWVLASAWKVQSPMAVRRSTPVDPMKEANAVSKLSEANLLDEERYWSETFGLSLDGLTEAIARVREAKRTARAD